MRSPLTQGGLEIKAKVTLKWDDEAKFLLFKEKVETNYRFDRSCQDESDSILESIKKMIIGDGEARVDDEEAENDDMDVDNDIPIFVDSSSSDDEID